MDALDPIPIGRRPLQWELPGPNGLPDADGWMPGFAWVDINNSTTWNCHHSKPWPGHTTLYYITGRIGTENERLYVGITENIFRRFTQHRATKDWWALGTGAVLQCMVSREVALRVEMEHIQGIGPRFNIVGRIR